MKIPSIVNAARSLLRRNARAAAANAIVAKVQISSLRSTFGALPCAADLLTRAAVAACTKSAPAVLPGVGVEAAVADELTGLRWSERMSPSRNVITRSTYAA